jgi:hypothetical protein
MSPKQKELIKDAMDVLMGNPAGGVGPNFASMEEMIECWQQGKCLDDDASTDICQHAYRLLEKALEET